MSALPEKHTHCSVTDKYSLTRLSLINESYIYEGKESGSNFHSMVLESRNAGAWITECTIGRDEFNENHLFDRWISDIHSLESTQGIAIIRVAEGFQGAGPGEIFYEYSWRKWDIFEKREIELLKVCLDPFEKYTGESS